jgi:cysteine synthase
LDHEVVDRWIKSEDKESFTMSRKLIREEGMKKRIGKNSCDENRGLLFLF